MVELHRSGETLRSIAATMTAEGHRLSKDAIARHIGRCTAPHDEVDLAPDPAGLTVAIAARDALKGWPSIARRLAERLYADGADAAADIVASSLPETMHSTTTRIVGTPVQQRLEAEALAASCAAVLGSHPQVARDIAASLRARGALDLADGFLRLASDSERAPRPPASADLKPRPEGSASPRPSALGPH
ncbi:hypothetical protein ASD06_17140 [Angustibacter sp. Root456]|nr:hypothetical protein ASD06_17140 [Angustibacter sp. Root456]